MEEDVLTARIDCDVTIAVATKPPWFCVGAVTAAQARAAAERARAFYRASARSRPAATGPVGKPDYVRPVREG